MGDTYYTVEHAGTSKVTEKMSRFLGFAVHVRTADEARSFINDIRNRYHDSRHVCWAYMLGPERDVWQLNDNGEPSGTAGKPILGQINSSELTDVVVAVVRYFGGIKLGTSGLIAAYRAAASEALANAGKKELHVTVKAEIYFPYIGMNDVMKVIKSEDVVLIDQEFGNTCRFQVETRKDHADRVFGRLKSVSGVSLERVS